MHNTQHQDGWKYDPIDSYNHINRKRYHISLYLLHHYRIIRNHHPISEHVLPNILEAIGNTPLVQLQRIPSSNGLKCRILAKCEYFNPGGSIKDRISRRMIEEAEREGKLNSDSILIEPTSGNTGIGLALVNAVKRYHTTVAMPEKTSQEKTDLLKALGAQVIKTPTEASFDSPESNIAVAHRLGKELPNAIILDQYSNVYNPISHYDETIEEILTATEQGIKLDMIVCGVGTGGTLTGIASRIKSVAPHVKIVGVDPEGSILAQPNHLNEKIHSYKVEGIGYDFVPRVLDRTLVDEWVKINDKDSFLMARRLIREEGLLCGGSSGGAVVAACKAAMELDQDQTCVVILPDSVHNYMSKFLNDGWMVANQFITDPVISWMIQNKTSNQRLSSLNEWKLKDLIDWMTKPLALFEEDTMYEAFLMMNYKKQEWIVIQDSNHQALGIVIMEDVMKIIMEGKDLKKIKSITHCRNLQNVTLDATFDDIEKILDHTKVVFILKSKIDRTVMAAWTKIDLNHFIWAWYEIRMNQTTIQ